MATSTSNMQSGSQGGDWLNDHCARSLVKIKGRIDTTAAVEKLRQAGFTFAAAPPPAFELRLPRKRPAALESVPLEVYEKLTCIYSLNAGGANVLGLSNIGPGVYNFKRGPDDQAVRMIAIDVSSRPVDGVGELLFVAPLSEMTGRDPGVLAILAAKYHLSDEEWSALGEDAGELVPDDTVDLGGGSS